MTLEEVKRVTKAILGRWCYHCLNRIITTGKSLTLPPAFSGG